MIQWLIEHLRSREADQVKSLRGVQDVAESTVHEAMAEYDAFVARARAVGDGLLLGTARSSTGEEIPIRIPWGDEYRMWEVAGGTGSGKTTWVTSILAGELVRGRPTGLIDGKGDLFEAAIRRTAAIAQGLEPEARQALARRIVVIDPFSDALVPLNVCRPLPGVSAEVTAYEVTLAFSRLFDAGMGLHMENVLRHAVLLAAEAGLTLVEIPEILQDEVLRGILASRSTNPVVKEFFFRSYPAIPQVSKDALLSRLQSIFAATAVRLMLGADECVDLRRVFDTGAPLFVFLGKGPGVPEEQVEILGSLLTQLLFQAAYARGSGQRRSYLLAVDEFFHLLSAPALAKRFETALTTARAYGLHLLLVHHAFAQLPTRLREVILANCDLVAIFRTSGRNARFFGDFLPEADPKFIERACREGRSGLPREEARRLQLEALQRLPNRHCYWYDRSQPYRALRLRVPDLAPAHVVAGVSERQLEELIEREGWRRGAAAVSRAVLCAQTETRRRRLRELLRPPISVTRPAEDDRTVDAPAKGKRRPKLG